MPRPNPIATVIAVTALMAMPVLAQQPAQTESAPPAETQPSSSPPSGSLSSPTGVVATTNNPNLAVATVRLETGVRASKIIGTAVQNEQNQRVGTVDDLIVSPESKVTIAIISVGGFLGIGSKLVAVPWDQIKAEGDHLILPGASKENLNAAPNFQY